MEKEQRTPKQNNALHQYFEMVAQTLNDAGYTVQLVLNEKMDLDWDKDMVKELLWRPAQKALIRKNSTTELEKQKDIDLVYDHLTRFLGERFGVYVEFPSLEMLERYE